MVDHQLLNINNHYDSLIKYAISLSIMAIPVSTKNVGIFYIILGIRCHKYFYKHVIVVNT